MTIPVIESIAEDAEVDVADEASTIAQPTGTTTGDFVFNISGVEADDLATTAFDDTTNKPTGFTLIDDFGEGGNVDVWGGAFYREITGGESWPIAVAFDVAAATVDFCGITLRVSSVNSANPVNVQGTAQTFTSAAAKTLTSITTTENDCLGVAVFLFDGADGSTIALDAGSTSAGWAIVAEHIVNTGAVGLTLAIATKDQASAGALSDCTFVPAVADGGAGLMFAIEGILGPSVTGANLVNSSAIDITFSESVTEGAGGSGGFVANLSGGNSTLTVLSSQYPGTTIRFSTDRTVYNNETGTISYTQPGNGVETSADGTDVLSMSGVTITGIPEEGASPIPSVTVVAGTRAEGTLTITGINFTGTTGVTYAGITLSDVVVNSDTEITATHIKGGVAFGSSNDLVVTNASGSSTGYSFVFSPPLDWQYITLITDYASLPEESMFFGLTGLSGLVATDQVAYETTADNFDFDAEMVLDTSLSAGIYDFDYYILDASDSYSAGTTGNIEFTVADTVPDAFSFTDATDVNVSTLTTSNAITVAGIDAPAEISVDIGEYRINAGSWTSSAGEVSLGDEVTLRITSSSSINTAVAITADIGGVTDVWTVTTLAIAATGAVLNAAGDTITLTVEPAQNIGVGGEGGLVLNTPSGAVALSGFRALTNEDAAWDTARVIYSNESPLTISYTQPGDGIEDDDTTDLASFSGLAVTNNSTVPNPSIGSGDGALNSGIRGSLRTSLRGL